MEILTDALIQSAVIIISTLVIVLSTGIGDLIKRLAEERKQKVGNEKFLAEVTMAEVVVNAADQLFEATDTEAKFRYASKALFKQLHDRGIVLSVDQIQTLIESAVKAKKQLDIALTEVNVKQPTSEVDTMDM